ncbi:MAG TPA: hypothetical protein VJ877_00130, partial [Bacteroidales bacterium]|nr:hypothetical protein [Bacteroidales bacterium]
ENAIASAREKAEKLKLSEEELQQVLTQIKRYYSNKREKIEQEEKENLLSSQEEFKSKWEQKLFEQNATELEILRRNKQNVLQIAKEKAEKLKITEEEWQTVKNQIVQYYSNEEERIIEEKNNSIIEKTKQLKEKMGNAYKLLSDDIKDYMLAIKDNTEVAAESAADAIVSFVDTVASGQKSLKEAIKDMTLSLITSFEKQVIAAQLTAEGIAAAMAVWDFGAALARFFAALPKILATLAAFEALKAGIRGLETGGLVTAPTLAMVGEGLNDEAVIPLNSQVFSQLADGITSKMNTGNSPLEIDVTINQNINNREDADRAGDSVVSSLSKKLQDRGVVLANR